MNLGLGKLHLRRSLSHGLLGALFVGALVASLPAQGVGRFDCGDIVSWHAVDTARREVRGRADADYLAAMLERVTQYRLTWEKRSLQRALDEKFGGRHFIVSKKGHKVYYFRENSALVIVDDPIGHYFRIARVRQGELVYVDYGGNFVHGRNSEPRTHFDYSQYAQEPLIEQTPPAVLPPAA